MIPDMIDWLCANANEAEHNGDVYDTANIQALIDEVKRTYPLADPEQDWKHIEITGLSLLLFRELFADDDDAAARVPLGAEEAQRTADEQVERIASASRAYVEELRGEIADLKREIAAGTNMRAIAAMQTARTLIFVLDAQPKDRQWKHNVLDVLDGVLADAGHPVVGTASPAIEAQPVGGDDEHARA